MNTVSVTNRVLDVVYLRSRFALVCHLLLVIALGLAAYSNTFTASFNFDDVNAILGNPVVRNVDTFVDPMAVKGTRFVGILSFALNYRLHGFTVFGYHLVNLVIHLITALLVYALVLLTCRTPFFSGGERGDGCRLSGPIALVAALFFVAHPLQTQAVTYIVQRVTSLATMFYLAALVLYIKARLTQGEGTRRGRMPVVIISYLLSLVAAVLAMKTKEIAFTLPFMVILFEFMFFRGSIAKRVAYLGGFILSLAIIPLSLAGSFGGSWQFLVRLFHSTKVQTEMPRFDYLVTQFRVIVTYLRLLFFPVGQNLDHDFTVYHTFFTPPVLLSFLLLVSIFGLGVFLVQRSTFNVQRSTSDNPQLPHCRLIALGIFWFFITLAVESSIIPIVDVIFEHRVYLPSVGVFVALSTALVLAADRLAVRRERLAAIMFIAMLLVAVSLAAATFGRNMVWADETTLWEDAAAKSPEKSRPWNNVAYAYLKRRQPQKAIPALIHSIAISPGHPDAWNNIGIALTQLGTYTGRFSPTYEQFDRGAAINPTYQNEWFALGYNNLGLAYDSLGQSAEAVESFEKAVTMNPNLAVAHYNLGLAYVALKDRQRAGEQYTILLSLKSEFAPQLLKAVKGER
jgi:hypothetical protein